MLQKREEHKYKFKYEHEILNKNKRHEFYESGMVTP